jgi:NMD protein affecting ribosome stability and mRNA decay
MIRRFLCWFNLHVWELAFIADNGRRVDRCKHCPARKYETPWQTLKEAEEFLQTIENSHTQNEKD